MHRQQVEQLVIDRLQRGLVLEQAEDEDRADDLVADAQRHGRGQRLRACRLAEDVSLAEPLHGELAGDGGREMLFVETERRGQPEARAAAVVDRQLLGADEVDDDLLDGGQDGLALDAGVQLVRGHVEVREVAALLLDVLVLLGEALVLAGHLVEARAQALQLTRHGAMLFLGHGYRGAELLVLAQQTVDVLLLLLAGLGNVRTAAAHSVTSAISSLRMLRTFASSSTALIGLVT